MGKFIHNWIQRRWICYVNKRNASPSSNWPKVATLVNKVSLSFFFWIGNNTFIEKNWTSCSRWWTLWTGKQIQKDQELKEIETKKSDTAEQFIHPQTQAQRNRVRKRCHFRCSNVLALSSNWSIRSHKSTRLHLRHLPCPCLRKIKYHHYTCHAFIDSQNQRLRLPFIQLTVSQTFSPYVS